MKIVENEASEKLTQRQKEHLLIWAKIAMLRQDLENHEREMERRGAERANKNTSEAEDKCSYGNS